MAAMLTLSDTRYRNRGNTTCLQGCCRVWIPHRLLVGVQSGSTAPGNNLTLSVSMKSNQRMTLPLTPGNSSKRKERAHVRTERWTQSVLAAWSVRIPGWKEPRHPSASKRLKTYWVPISGKNASQLSTGWTLWLLKQAPHICCIHHCSPGPASCRRKKIRLRPKIQSRSS